MVRDVLLSFFSIKPGGMFQWISADDEVGICF